LSLVNCTCLEADVSPWLVATDIGLMSNVSAWLHAKGQHNIASGMMAVFDFLFIEATI
jgi:hypothetical protein